MKKQIHAILAGAAIAAMLAAKADTVVWYTFDDLGDVGTRLAEASTIQNKANPETLNATVYGMISGAKNSSSVHRPYVTNGLAETMRVLDPVGKTGASSADKALRFPGTNAAGQGSMLEIPNDPALRPSSFTVEMFVRLTPDRPAWQMLACQPSSTAERYGWSIIFKQYSNLGVVLDFIKPDGTKQDCEFNIGTVFYDWEWHHIAMTVAPHATDPSKSIVRFYVDHDRKYNYENAPFALTLSDSADCPVQIGGTTVEGGRLFMGEIGEFRFSDAALEPAGFLTSRTCPQGRTIAHLKFDDSTANAAEGGGALFEGPDSSSLTFSDDVPGYKITDGEGGSVLSKPDVKSLSVPSSAFTWSNWSDQYFLRMDTNGNERTSGTVELWVKVAEAKRWGVILNAKLTSNSAWRLGLDSIDGKNPSVLFYPLNGNTRTDERKNFIVDSTDGIIDGKWHHWAFTFQPNASDPTKSDIDFYFDYNKIGSTYTLTKGRVAYDDSLMFSISLGGSNVAALIDEVRISDCVLDPSEFLRAEKQQGLILIFR